ncbi:hypothetical protein AA3990_0135 [Gluconobacter roseus NBRC 3990]|nr:hypothetical protein AA3990_0135 [Gluconobacter roseus NBRC 3990]
MGALYRMMRSGPNGLREIARNTGRLSLKRVSVLTALFALSTASAMAQQVPAAAAPDADHNAQRVVVMDGTFRPSAYFPNRGAGYFTIRNDDSVDHLLKGISSPLCQNVVAHHTNQQQTDGANDLFTHLALPHNSTMIFPRSGYHMMCMGIRQMPAKGDKVPFTFDILNGGSITVSFTVTEPDELTHD